MAGTLLTIAGFDPSSGAGITADLQVFAAHGYFGTSAVTALTVQSTLGVVLTAPVAAKLLCDTLETLVADLPPVGIKVGMLATEEHVLTVAGVIENLRQRAPLVVVVDPIVRSSSGRELLSAAGVTSLREHLLPLADWVTPNRDELGQLLGRPVRTRAEMEAGAATLSRQYQKLGVVVTGGDLQAADDLVWAPGGPGTWMGGARLESDSTHGTGCAFSSALLCGLAMQPAFTPDRAAHAAKDYVTKAIRTAAPLGGGHGPMNLLWPLRPWQG